MTTLRAIEITNSSSSFLDAVRRIMKEEPELSEGAAIEEGAW
jgi:2-keto-3-deoxy-6-phosphogluconate aldolase